jgi:hypothetical protein
MLAAEARPSRVGIPLSMEQPPTTPKRPAEEEPEPAFSDEDEGGASPQRSPRSGGVHIPPLGGAGQVLSGGAAGLSMIRINRDSGPMNPGQKKSTVTPGLDINASRLSLGFPYANLKFADGGWKTFRQVKVKGMVVGYSPVDLQPGAPGFDSWGSMALALAP